MHWLSKEHLPNPYAILGICAVALSRILFRSHVLYDIDSVNFALGISRFDPTAHQPHPPGYFLYVCLARLVNLFFADPNTSLVAISIGASCGAAYLVYLLARSWFNEGAARCAVMLFLFSPLCWFHGIVALTYILETFFAGLIGYLCWQVYRGRTAFAIPAAIAFGVAAGFRPSTALILGPLTLISLWRAQGAWRWAAMLTIAAVILLWFIPMAEAAGGMRQYLGSVSHLWSSVPGRRTTLTSPWLAVARAFTIGWIFVLCFGAGSLLLFCEAPDRSNGPGRRFLTTWILPGFLFFAFVFLNYVNSGYLLVLSPPLFAIFGARLWEFIQFWGERPWPRIAVVIGVIVNCAVFGFAPLYCSSRSVRSFEQELTAVTRDLRAIGNPEKTLIVGFDSHFLGYRHAGYYLPEFVTVQYPEVGYPDGKRVFIMHGGDTTVAPTFSADSFQRFVLFPLPGDDEYTVYLQSVVDKLPQGTLRTLVVGERKLLYGDVKSVGLLFPSTARHASEVDRDSPLRPRALGPEPTRH